MNFEVSASTSVSFLSILENNFGKKVNKKSRVNLGQTKHVTGNAVRYSFDFWQIILVVLVPDVALLSPGGYIAVYQIVI